MNPDAVSATTQMLPQLSAMMSNPSSPRENGSGSPNTGAQPVIKEGKPVPVDTVSISDQSRQAVTDVKKEEAKTANTSEKATVPMAKVQFIYDVKGQLRVRYMDTADRLIYQVPSELLLRMREAASKSDSSVDTKA